MKSWTAFGFWTASAFLLVLGIAEIARPGFLALGRIAGWGWISLLALTAFCLGAATGLIFRGLRRGGSGPRSRRSLYAVAVALVVALPLVGWFLANRGFASEPRFERRVIVLGVDGASLDQIEPMIDDGDLPNFARLRDEGVLVELTSQNPTLSPRVWTTIATGVSPDVHGAQDFLSTQQSIAVPRIWEVVSAGGGRIGLFGWLLTWPPGEPDGFVVPGWLARGSDSWPPQLGFFQQLKGGGADRTGILGLVGPAWQGYLNGVRLPTLAQAASVKIWTRLARPDDQASTPPTQIVQSEMAADVFVHWLRRVEPDFSALVLYAVDTFTHRYWGDFDPESIGRDSSSTERRFRDAIPRAYRQADRTLGRILDLADEDTLVFVVSDHGSGPGKAAQNKYSLSPEVLTDLLKPILPVRAFSVTDQVLVRPLESTDRVRLEEILRSATTQGKPLFSVLPSGSEFLSVELSEGVDPQGTAVLTETELPISQLVVESEFTGGHTLRGIIGFWGRDVDPQAAVKATRLVDVAPTLLAFMGLPVSRQLEGRVLSEVLRPELAAELNVREVPFYDVEWQRGSAEEAEVESDVQELLRTLGYLQ